MFKIFTEQKETSITLFLLLLLAIVFYLFSLYLETSSFEISEHVIETIDEFREGQKTDKGLRSVISDEIESIKKYGFYSELLIHLSIAFVVAIIIILSVEIYTSDRIKREIMEYRNAVAKEVWSAIFGKFIPGNIVTEIDDIYMSQVIKEKCRYILTLMPLPTTGNEPRNNDFLLLRRHVIYKLKNITGKTVEHEIRAYISNPYPDIQIVGQNGNTITCPCHVELKIDDENIELIKDNNLLKNENNQYRNLIHKIKLPKESAPKTISLITDEQFRLRDSTSYIELIPVDGIEVFVNTKCDGIAFKNVNLYHPNWKDFKPGPDGSYIYDGGILPGQGFEIIWAPINDID